LLDAGRVLATSENRDTGQRLESVNHGSTAPPNERQARELAPLLEKPEQLRETWAEVRGFHSNPTAADVHEAVERKLAPKSRVLEKDFQKAVTDALNALGWRWHHSRPARTSKGWRTALSGDAGYPDITAVRRDRILFIELNAEKGRLSEEQGVWLADLGAAGAETHCWRPSDWPAIKEALR